MAVLFIDIDSNKRFYGVKVYLHDVAYSEPLVLRDVADNTHGIKPYDSLPQQQVAHDLNH